MGENVSPACDQAGPWHSIQPTPKAVREQGPSVQATCYAYCMPCSSPTQALLLLSTLHCELSRLYSPPTTLLVHPNGKGVGQYTGYFYTLFYLLETCLLL